MKKLLILFIKGVVIGIGKVIPGVSGSVIAITLGVYDKGVFALNHFFKDFKNNFIFLFVTGIGILTSIVFGSKLILLFLNKYNFLVMSFFLGLILNSILKFRKIISINKKNTLIILMISLVSFLLCFIGVNNIYEYQFTFFDNLFLVFVGFIEAATMIIPGISGTSIMMILGVYNLILATFSNLYSINYIQYNLSILLPFFLGFILGFILITKFVEKVILNNKSSNIYILGFIIGSYFVLFYKTITYFSINLFFLSILLFILGFIISYLFINHK